MIESKLRNQKQFRGDGEKAQKIVLSQESSVTYEQN